MTKIENSCINTIRLLACEMINKASSGHPGVPTGCAAIIHTLFTRHLKFNPREPNWLNRDRFILSNGHGSSLLYVINHLCGYNISMEDLKQFRQLGSKTPGHPEFGVTPGVELSTGPLGVGFSSALGFAIGEKHMASIFNRPDFNVYDHYTYVLFGDGCFMEGVSYEAMSLAGKLKLNNLICFYDDNSITIDGNTNITFTEDVKKRCETMNWSYFSCNGNNINEIDECIKLAKLSSKPSIISCKTIIGKDLKFKEGTNKAHGNPPSDKEIELMMKNYDVEEKFFVSEEVKEFYNNIISNKIEEYNDWVKMFVEYKIQFPHLYSELNRRLTGDISKNISQIFKQEFPVIREATRISSGKVFNQLSNKLPELIGGSADLGSSVKCIIPGVSFNENRSGRNIYFGIREFLMGNISNALSIYGGLISYCSTFLVFSDYLRNSIRMAAISNYPSKFIFTHDSIGVGEDGPTHQPIEQLSSLRSIPNCLVIRPSDLNETLMSWKIALENKTGPTVLILARQDSNNIDRNKFNKASNLSKGAYVLKDYIHNGEINLILMASGTEVDLMIKVGEILFNQYNINVRLVSFPSWELFNKQSQEYKDSVLLRNIINRISIEASSTFGWSQYVGFNGLSIGIDEFGRSGKGEELYKYYGLTPNNIVQKAIELINRNKNNIN